MSRFATPSISLLLAGVLATMGLTPAEAKQLCKPTLAITQVQFSEWQLPTMERKWTAVVTVDASPCAANASGHFEMGFERLIENGKDLDFTQEFAWMSPAVKVGVDFWANEYVHRAWIHKVSPCACAQ